MITLPKIGESKYFTLWNVLSFISSLMNNLLVGTASEVNPVLQKHIYFTGKSKDYSDISFLLGNSPHNIRNLQRWIPCLMFLVLIASSFSLPLHPKHWHYHSYLIIAWLLFSSPVFPFAALCVFFTQFKQGENLSKSRGSTEDHVVSANHISRAFASAGICMWAGLNCLGLPNVYY